VVVTSIGCDPVKTGVWWKHVQGHSTMSKPAVFPIPQEKHDLVSGTVTQSNRLLESAHTLTLREKQLVLLAASQLDPHGQADPDATITVTAAQFATAFDIHINHAYPAMEQAVESLYNRTIRTIRTSPRGRVIKRHARWVWAAEYQAGEGQCALVFTPDVLRYLTDLRKEFTTLQLSQVGKLPTFHSVRLYELCMSAVATGAIEFAIDELRDVLNLKDQYPLFKDFRRYVIDESVGHINTHTELRVDGEYRREGRKVTGVSFTISQTPATAQKPSAAK